MANDIRAELKVISAERLQVELATRDGGIDSFDALHLGTMLYKRESAAREIARKPLYQAGNRIRHCAQGEAVVLGVTYGEWSGSLPIYRVRRGEVIDLWPAETIVERVG